MKNRIILIGFALLLSCINAEVNPSLQTIFEMELTENYDTSDPFVHEKLFCISENIDVLELDIALKMEGESGTIEILDNVTKEILWSSNTWTDKTNINSFTVTLDSLDKEKDYAVRFTGKKIKYAKVVVSSANRLVSELERPRANR